MSDFNVVVCGGGVAALEGLLRLRRLLGDEIDIQLIAPNDEFAYRPLSVKEPFAFGSSKSYPLERVVADTGAEWVKDTLAWVDADGRRAHTGERRELAFDALLIAVGARQLEDFEHALTFRDAQARDLFDEVIEDIEDGEVKSVAFIVPDGPSYPLPAYELAMMTANDARQTKVKDLRVVLVTPEPAPLAVFGGSAGLAVAERLEQAGVELYSSAVCFVPAPNRLLVQPLGETLEIDRIVAVPRVEGPTIRGLAGGGAHGFIPIDAQCCVPGTKSRVYAAGDATAYPIKHGGLGAQQADTAAAAIARLAGVDAEPYRYLPEIRGTLLTGAEPLYLYARLVGGKGFDSEVFDSPPWPVDEKIIAEELGPYLAGIKAA